MNQRYRHRAKAYRQKGSSPSVAIIGGAIMLGFVGGVGSALLPSSSSNAPVAEEESWRPQGTVASQSYMSAADLDDQQPSAPARRAEPERRSTASTDSRSSWSYRNCAQARAAALHLFMLGRQDMALIWTAMAMVLVASLIEGVSQNSRSPRNNAEVQQSSPYSLDLTGSSSSQR